MLLQMYIDGKLVESVLLSVHKINDYKEQDDYIRGAVHDLLEKWDDLIVDQGLQPELYIKV